MAALVSTAVVLGTLDAIPNGIKDLIDDENTTYNDSGPETPDLTSNTKITSSWIIAFSGVTIILQVLITVLCCFNVGLITMKVVTFRLIVSGLT